MASPKQSPSDLDDSGPIKSADDLSRGEMRRALAIVTVAWMFGSVWMNLTAGAPITQYAKALGASEFQFGLLAALPFMASFFSLPASLLIERTGARKRIFLWGLYTQRFMWIPIAIIPWLMLRTFGYGAAHEPAMIVFLCLILLMHSGQAIGGPGWVSWMADLVPDRARGKYFSRRRQWGILTAIPAAVVVGILMDRYAAPGAGGASHPDVIKIVAVIFLVACFFGVMDIFLFHWVRPIYKEPQRGIHLLKALAEPLRNRNFLWYGGMIATLVFAVSFMGQFVILHLIRHVGVDNTGIQLITLVTPMLAQLIVLPAWGKAADRMGKKPLLAIAGIGVAVPAFMWCFVTPEHIWLAYVASALGAATWTGVEIANFNLVLELSGSNDDPNNPKPTGGTSYFAMNSIILNVAGFAGGITSGIVAQQLEHWSWRPFAGMRAIGAYDVLFILSGILRLAAVVVFLPHIHEPTARGTREALRFMTANIYNNLFNAVLQPLRFVGSKLESYQTRK